MKESKNLFDKLKSTPRGQALLFFGGAEKVLVHAL